MSTTDLYTADFPHGTKDGYEQGCRGAGACPNHLTEEMTCKQAFNRYNSDWDYKRAIDAGVPWVEPVVVAEPVKAKSKAKPVAVPSPAEVFGLDTRAERTPATEFPHGTTAGYQRGCRDEALCPGDENGLTCREAQRAYSREYSVRRAAKKKAVHEAAVAGGVPADVPSIVVENHATEEGHWPEYPVPSPVDPAPVVEFDVESDPVAVLQAMAGELQEARQELAIARQRVVELSLELDVAKMAPRHSVSVEPTATGGVTVIVNVA